MKRIAIFCDGTWNRMAADYPTNVLMAARATKSVGADGIAQIKFYDEGVGTSFIVNHWLETRLAGAFGFGLIDKVEAAYRFLIFNYEPGDEIYIFGFSRGAFTARSLAGLIRKCGIVQPRESNKIKKIFDFYKDGATHPDSDASRQFRKEHSPHVVLKESDRQWLIDQGEAPEHVAALPLLNIRYVGVWDTVGALGIPRHLILSRIFRTEQRYGFHDTDLSSTVRSARHAVAVDERRLSFSPALWSNLDLLNRGQSGPPKYEQLWFPGDHGSVGGGGDVVGLSHNAFIWVMDGAETAGLALDPDYLAPLSKQVDHLAPLTNQSRSASRLAGIFYRKGDRIGPQQRAMLADSTVTRLEFEAKDDAFRPYRPKTLERLWPR